MVNILLGTGSGTFAAQQAFEAGGEPMSLVVGDFDSNGYLDVVTAGGGPAGNVTLLIGSGGGRFSAPVAFAAAGTPVALAALAPENNGPLAVAVASSGPVNEGLPSNGTVDVLLGTGAGVFGNQTTFTVGQQPTGIAIGDFNGDGLADLVTTNFSNGTVSVLLGAGAGQFGPQSTFPAGDFPVGVAVADFNGDGLLDLAVVSLPNDGPGSEQETPGTVSVLLGTGTGTFEPAAAYGALVSPTAIAVGDFTGDGLLDLVVTDEGDGKKAGVVIVLPGDGTGTFGSQTSFPVGVGPSAVVVSDFNGDGKPDLAVANGKDGTVSILLNDCAP
jgi:hypothetical protein